MHNFFGTFHKDCCNCCEPPFLHREPECCEDHCSHQYRPVKDVWMASAINLEKTCRTFYHCPKCKECILKSILLVFAGNFAISHSVFEPGLPPTHGNTNLSHCSAADCSWPSHNFQKRSAKYSVQQLLPTVIQNHKAKSFHFEQNIYSKKKYVKPGRRPTLLQYNGQYLHRSC